MSRDALVVGINNYEKITSLKSPSEDAEAIAQILTEYGEFNVTRLPGVKKEGAIRVGQQTKLTLVELQKALVQLFKPEGDRIPETALFFFSGHGKRTTLGIQEGFLATSDVDPNKGFYGLSLQWLRRLLEESPIKQQIVWLDCCYSGELLNFAEADPGERGKGRDRCFIAASREFEVAYEDVGEAHGVLTKALLQGLEPRQDSGGWVTNYTLVDVLNRQLQTTTQRPIFTNFGEPINLTCQRRPLTEKRSENKIAICPYKGLAYFDCNEEDPKYFYGREKLTDQLLDHVRQSNFLVIVGASGSGKSSVLRAGLIYQLQQGRKLSGSDQWQIYIVRPGEHPLQSLALAFVDANLSPVERAKQLGDAEDLIKQGATGLRRLVQASPSRVVLVIDQFEEVFTLCKGTQQHEEERRQFFACLLGGLSQTATNAEKLQAASLQIIIAMRADFFGKCLEQDYSGLAQQIQANLVTVTPMTPEDLRQAMVAPAKKVELEIEPELVAEMLADVENAPGILPLLEYTLTELWKQRSDNYLRLKTYAQLGRVMGTLKKRATDVYESFSEVQKEAVRHIFLSLTQLGNETEDTRKRVLKSDLVNERYPEVLIDEVVQRLADEKLIVTSEMVEKGGASERVAVVDVAHEALIRHWDILRKWVDENREKLIQERKIEVALGLDENSFLEVSTLWQVNKILKWATEWQSNEKSKDYLIRGKILKDAEDFLRNHPKSSDLPRLAKDFIQHSLKHKRNNRLKLIGFGLIVPLGLCVVLGIFAVKEIRIRLLWQTVDAAKQEKLSPARNQALQELVKAGVSLANINLYGANLSRANLSRANLNGADFSRANLNGADLSGANLNVADLGGANLNGADLNLANLSGADLSGADLNFANLNFANLGVADLSGANLNGANLNGANLNGANLRCVVIVIDNERRCTDLRGAKNLTPEQIKSAKNWQQAQYDPDFRKKLGLK
jgi:hypothetical protein